MPDDKELAKTEEPETKLEAIESTQKAEWYVQFCEDLRAEIVEKGYAIQQDYFGLNHSIGKQIEEKVGEFTNAQVYGQHITEMLAKDIQKSPSSLNKARMFYRTFSDLQKDFFEKHGKDIKYSQVVNELIPNSKEKVKKPKIKLDPINVETDEKDENGKPIRKKMYKIKIDLADFERIDWSEVKSELIKYLQSLP